MQTAEQIVERIKTLAIIPIVRVPDSDSAIRSVEAICEAGIPCAEITMDCEGRHSGVGAS
ncbi:MAG: hypothetical protein ACRD6B_01605 [Bryobacteraceae bacterium]